MKPIKQLILAIGILGLLGCATPLRCHATEKTIVLVESQEGKGSLEERWTTLIYTEAFRRLDYRLEIHRYPAARASALSDNGEVDGEISRVYDYNEAHPNLIRVEESHYSLSFAAFAVQPGIQLNGWESLRNTGYKVEYRLGSKKPEAALPRVVDAAHLSRVPTMEQGLKKLILGRTDIYIDVESIVSRTITELKRTDDGAAAIYEAGVMESFTAHAFLHKKNADLAPKIAEMLKAMKKEGLIEKYRTEATREK